MMITADQDPYQHATLVTGNGGRLWHVLGDTRTRCGQRTERWATLSMWIADEHQGRHAPATSRICRRCRLMAEVDPR